MDIPNRFTLRRKLFEYLTRSQTIADVVESHPQNPSNKPIIVVSPLSNTSKLSPTASINPEIQINYYAPQELQLTKETGLINTVENLMIAFLKSDIMPGYSNGYYCGGSDSEYISRIKLYGAFSIYKFYLGAEKELNYYY